MTAPGSLEDRLTGALLGTALGDAAGAPFEGTTSPVADRVDAWLGADGQLRWTDDTHMALALAASLIATGGRVDPQHLGDTFARAYAEEPWRGYGSGPPQVFARAARGEPYVEAAAALFGGSGSLGNGGAMRAAPVAIVGCPDLAEVARLARAQAAVTHAHPEGQDGAVLVAGGICAIVGVEDLRAGPVDALEQVGQHLRTAELRDPLDALVGVVRSGGDLDEAMAGRSTDVTAAGSVPAAVASFLLGGDSVVDVIRSAILLGGDTDTVAAMAGALAGAAYGASSIPAALLDRLEARDDVLRLAGQLIEVRTA